MFDRMDMAGACACMGPQNGEPECPCKMRRRRAEQAAREPNPFLPQRAPIQAAGCVCPVGAEATCRGLGCPRNPPMKQEYRNGELVWVR